MKTIEYKIVDGIKMVRLDDHIKELEMLNKEFEARQIHHSEIQKRDRFFLISYADQEGRGQVNIKVEGGLFLPTDMMFYLRKHFQKPSIVISSVFEVTQREYEAEEENFKKNQVLG